jgi:hypothetical protein
LGAGFLPLEVPVPWRVIAHGDQVWHVDAVAERPANTAAWQLVLSFRAASERPRGRAFWTLYPLEATSKTSLFIQAERIPDTSLSQLLAARLT